MANATDLVTANETVRRTDEYIDRPSPAEASAKTYWPGAMVGVLATGYLAKFDDTAGMIFFGIVRDKEGKTVIPAGATAGQYDIPVQQPQRFTLAVSGVTIADIGKKVYASDDKTGVLSNAALTYGNFVGHVVDVMATGVALVEPYYDGIAANARYGVSRWLAATGAQTLTKFDLNKVVFVPNSAALTVTLPPVADTQAGDRLTVVKTTAAAEIVTLDGNASETIDNATTLTTMDARYDCVTLVSTGTEWVVLNRDLA